MKQQLVLATAWLVLGTTMAAASNPCGGEKINAPFEVHNTPGVVTLWSLCKPTESAAHTYVITHGLSGIEARFFELGQAIQAKEPGAQVLVVEWDPAKKERIGAHGNPWAAAKRIDPTGDALGSVLSDLHKKKSIDLSRTTFIGESFGNYVNHRAVVVCRQADFGKVHGALILNPASELGGYTPPLMEQAYTHSVAFVSASILDTRKAIAAKTVKLKTNSDDPFAQHTFGLEWLHATVVAGNRISSHFAETKADNNANDGRLASKAMEANQ